MLCLEVMVDVLSLKSVLEDLKTSIHPNVTPG